MPYADPARKRAYDATRYRTNPDAAKARANTYRRENALKVREAQAHYRTRYAERIATCPCRFTCNGANGPQSNSVGKPRTA